MAINDGSNPPVYDPFAQFIAQQNPQTPAAQPEDGPLFNVGGVLMNRKQLATMAGPNAGTNMPNQAQDLATLRSFAPPLNAGPYAPTAQGEAETARQYQNRVNSPYMLFGANNRFAQGHPRLAGMLDNAFLGGSLVNEAHQRALAAGGGVEGAGGAVGDVMSGLLQIPEARLAYRQNLENMGLQRESQQLGIEAQRVEIAERTAQGLSAIENQPARIASELVRGQAAEQIRAQEAWEAAQLRNQQAAADRQARIDMATNSNDTKRYVAQVRAMKASNPQAFQQHQDQFYQQLRNHLQQDNANYQKMLAAPAGVYTADQLEAERRRTEEHILDEMEVAQRVAAQSGYSDPWQTIYGPGAAKMQAKSNAANMSALPEAPKTAPKTKRPSPIFPPRPATHQFSVSAWKAANPKGNVNAAKKAAQAQGYTVVR